MDQRFVCLIDDNLIEQTSIIKIIRAPFLTYGQKVLVIFSTGDPKKQRQARLYLLDNDDKPLPKFRVTLDSIEEVYKEYIIYEEFGVKIIKMAKVNFTRDMALRNLKLRSELFNRLPTITNMILTFEITDALILQTYKLGGLDMQLRATEKSLERYEKCKNLAMKNQNFNERKLAFNRTLEIFYKVIGEVINVTE